MPIWSLPESIADILPSEARKIEELRRALLDLFRSYGYELVMPPLLEYTESLLSGTGRDMDLQMFKLVDQLSGRTMGLRADMTPQVARIDAHLLNRAGVTRLCYAGSVLHTRPGTLSGTREPLQVGAEVYGHAGLEADLEVQSLLLRALEVTGIGRVRLDLGHVEIPRAILGSDPISPSIAEEVYPLLNAKDKAGIEGLSGVLRGATIDALVTLCDLYGGPETIDTARLRLPGLPRIGYALDKLSRLVDAVDADSVTIDLCDIRRGYHYHSGVMFCAYAGGLPNPVARGGRYDEVGQAFGRSRAAAGFSLYLRDIAPVLPTAPVSPAIRAPWVEDSSLSEAIEKLRAAGEIVIQTLPGHENEQDEFACDRALTKQGQGWHVIPLGV